MALVPQVASKAAAQREYSTGPDVRPAGGALSTGNTTNLSDDNKTATATTTTTTTTSYNNII